jgi:hypothetical protein
MIKGNGMNPRMRFTLVILAVVTQLTVSCTNINQGVNSLNTAALGTSVTTASSSSTVYSHTLSQFSFAADASGAASSNPNIILSLTTNTSAANYQPLTGFCGLNSTNPCVCEMVWAVAYVSGGHSNTYSRTKRVPVKTVQSGLVTCSLDGQTWSEIPDTTVISFRILPVSTNITGLNTTTLHWKKGTSLSADGDFLDDTLTPFRNIHRYTCFSKNAASRAYELVNQFAATSASGASSSAQPINVIMGSRYCSGASSGSSSAGGSSNGSASCPPPRNGFTAQSYYRNFFIRSDQLGTINSTNDTYDCPKVLESIKYSAGQTIPASESGKYYPLDSTFAVATTHSTEWNVGIPAATNIYKANDANSVQTACSDEAAGTPNRLKDGKVVVKCLGYARKPATNGTCGTIKDSNGRVRPLTRLRRFRVVYPPLFDANGKIVAGNAMADEVYVADRLVVDASGNATGNMIYGPKPCNFAWFDHEGVTTRDGINNFFSNLRGDVLTAQVRCNGGSKCYATPGYIATSKYNYVEGRNAGLPAFAPVYGLSGATYGGLSWSVDPDGLVLPNTDHTGNVSNAQNYPSCSVTLPWVDWQNGAPQDVRLITTHTSRLDKVSFGSRDIYLREIHNTTIDPWTPNYVEDISFNACVPLPTTIVEPPMQIYQKDANTMAWCAAVYPTQNPYWYDLNKFRKPQNGGSTLTANLVNYGPGAAPTGTAPVDTYTSHDPAVGIPDPLDADGLNASCGGTKDDLFCTMTGFTTGATLAGCKTYLAKATRSTCDRTVMFDSNQQFLGFPLLAKDTDINTMLSDDLNHDKVFGCEYSVNTDASKIGLRMPSSGCCGFGGSIPHKLLRNLSNGKGGHLEPFKDPAATDDSRFCGWPVE